MKSTRTRPINHLSVALTATLITLTGDPGPAGALTFNAIDLGPLPQFADNVVDVNDLGFVIGNVVDAMGVRTPMIWDVFGGGGPVPLDGLDSSNNVTRINNHGDVVGWGNNASGQRGFINHGATRTVTPLGDLGGAVRPFSINDAGRIVGAEDGSTGSQIAFYTDNLNTLNSIGTLPGHTESFARNVNAAGTLVGAAQGGSPSSEAFIYDGSVNPVGTLGTRSDAFAINDNNLIVGNSTIPGSGRRAFLSNPSINSGAPFAIGTFGGESFALDINNAGLVVGTSETSTVPNAATRGFLYDGEFHDLNDLLNPNDPVAMITRVKQAIAINDNNDVLVIGTVLGPGEGPGDFFDTGERHGYLLTTAEVGLPDPVVEVEAFARHATDDPGTAGPIIGTVLVAVEQTATRPEATSQEQNDFDPYDLSRGRAEALITNVGVPTVGSLSQAGGHIGIFNDCDPLAGACTESKEAGSVARVVSHLTPFFFGPPPATPIDLDLDLHVDGKLDIGWFYEDINIPELAGAYAEVTITAKLHTSSGETVLFEGGASLERTGLDEADLEFYDDWEDIDPADRSFPTTTSWSGVPNAELAFGALINGVPGELVVRNDDLETEAHMLMVQQSYEDVAFLQPNEVYALELIIETYVDTESVNFFGQLPQDFIDDCLFGDSGCDPDEFPAAALFVIDHGFALADFLNTAEGFFTSNTPGVSFIAVDESGQPLFPVPEPGVGVIMLIGGIPAALRRRRHTT